MPNRQAAVHDSIVGQPQGHGAARAFIVSAITLMSSLFLAFVLSGSTTPGSGPLEGANLFAFLALCAFWLAVWAGTVWVIATAGLQSRN